MKILINRTTNRISGAEIYNLNLIKGLLHYKDIEVIFSSDYSKLNAEIKELGVPVVSMHSLINEIGTKRQFIIALLFLPKIFINYWKYFKKVGKFELVIFESMNEKIFLTLPLKLFNKHIIWIEHGPLFISKRALVIKIIYKFLSKHANKILCVSKSTQLDLIKAGVNRSKTSVCYIGIDTDKFAPLDEKRKYKVKLKVNAVNKTIIGYLGTLNKEKGIFDFIQAAKLLVQVQRSIFFVIIGGGDQMEKVKSIIKEENLSEYCFLTDYISDIREYLGVMDVLVFPTHHSEGLSMSLIEASSMGIPIVASDVGGNKEIVINALNGFLYKHSSCSNIKTLITLAIKNRKVLGKKARQLAVDKFSLKSNTDAFYSLFKEVYYEK